jgi:hypothetical protein
MACEIKKSVNTNSTIEKPEGDDGLIVEHDTEKTLLHPFFVSALKSIYNHENEDSKLADTTGFDDKRRD